ncbi:SMEK domain-containing protein [Chitinophaga ginsengisoli]|uniref:SMEK domain-containing protein n=1 Tax=Chitinophaga ginsengisoli TaxID=363837 RepID=A0A2P8GCV8_9BACT|nr:SMEK domain-containing protein [Chitinophaga ginsengisoli]PSL31715.1 hypothetical protein CLV42_1047 [Chitinophaga ginsengisoli]
MPKEKIEIDEISHLVAVWIAKIGITNALNYYDINKASEGTCLQLLNLVYGYELIDYKEQKRGIDLGDSGESKIAFQVTSRTDFSKIKHTLKLFYESDLSKEFPNGIKFLILSNQKVRVGKLDENLQRYFNTESDILYPADLIREITLIYRNDAARFQLIKQFLNREFGEKDIKSSSPSLIGFPDLRTKLDHFKMVMQGTLNGMDSQLVHFPCTVDNSSIWTNELTFELFKHTGYVISGISGCGKTILALHLTSLFLKHTGAALYIGAKYYESDLSALIDKEVKEYGFSSGYDFFKVCRGFSERILIVIDGLNECTKSKQFKLLTELKLIINKYNCNYLITTQVLDENIQDLASNVIRVEQPTLATKQAIAEKFSNISQRLVPVLEMVTTSYEAKMVGEIGIGNMTSVSRFTIFDLFVRKKLEHFNHRAHLILSRVAQFLSDKISFALSIRQTDNLINKYGFDFSLLEECLKSGLIVKKLDKISFAHEMLFNYFTADSISRFSESSEKISLALKSPRNYYNRLLAIGSIEETDVLLKVLDGIYDSKLILAIHAGEAGAFCQKWAEGRFTEVLPKMANEIKGIQFEITDADYWPVRIKTQTIFDWTPQEFGFICAIPTLFYDGLFLKEIFELTNQMDIVCSQQLKDLREEAKQKGISINSDIFHAIYIGVSSTKSAITQIFSVLSSGFARFGGKNNINKEVVEKLLESKSLKNGQLYLLLLLCRYDDSGKLLYPYVADALENKWKFIPYNLQHQILDTVGSVCDSAAEEQRLIAALNKIHAETKLPMISSSIFDALSSLGALADDANAYEETVTDQLNAILHDPHNEEQWNIAAGIFYAQYDHPYEYAFSIAIEKLDLEQKKSFYKMALGGYYSTFFTCSLIFTAAKLLGDEIAPYLLRYAKKTIEANHSVQDAAAVLIISNIFLGQFSFQVQIHHEQQSNESSNALLAIGEIYYWLNRSDMDLDERKGKCKKALEYLFEKSAEYAVEVVWESWLSLSHLGYGSRFNSIPITLNDAFPEHIAKACRSAIEKPYEQKSLYPFERTQETILHAINLLAKHGNATDIILLKNLSEDDQLGRTAIDAIKELESI